MQLLGKFALVAILLACSAAFAQRGAASKASGDYNFYSNAGGTSVNHALDYAVDYQQYAQETPDVNPQIARDQATAISNSIAKAQKHFTEARKTTTDPQDQAALDAINQHLANAAKSHAEMLDKCNQDDVDAEGTMKCCNETVESLQKAQAEHQNLTGGNNPDSTK